LASEKKTLPSTGAADTVALSSAIAKELRLITTASEARNSFDIFGKVL